MFAHKIHAFGEYVMREVKRVEYNRERFESANYKRCVYMRIRGNLTMLLALISPLYSYTKYQILLLSSNTRRNQHTHAHIGRYF